MASNKATKEWELESTEVGKSVGNNKGRKIKVYIPKVLPLVKFSKPKIKTESINKNCFVNSSKCKVSVSNKVKTANYISLYANHVTDTSLKHGDTVYIDIENDNIDKMSVKN